VPVEVLSPARREQAEKAASLLLTLQRMEKDLSARLKEWLRVNGPIQVGDLVYGPTTITSYDFNAQAVATFLLEAGISRDEVWGILSVTKTNLERGLRKGRRKDLLECIRASAVAKVSERIEFRKETQLP
jgi:hypothetical protein